VLLGKLVHLLRSQAGVGKHANLAGDVTPVMLRTELLQVLLEQGAHLDDAIGHALNLNEPLLVQLGRIEDLGSDAGAVDRGVGVHGADQYLDLRVNTFALLCALTHDGESTDALAVQAHVLGERLGQTDVVALLNEVAHREGILVDVAAGEALIGHVEEGEVALLLHGGLDLLPLLRSRVDTSRIVGAGVEQEHAAVGGLFDVRNQALKVKADGILVVIGILLDLEAGIREDIDVVGPRGGGNVNGLLAGVEAGEEGSANAQSTSTRDGLGDGQTVKSRAVLAVGEYSSGLGELGKTRNGSVLFVQASRNHLLLSLAHRW